MITLEFLARNSGYIITMITLLTLLIRPIRQALFALLEKMKKNEADDKQLEALVLAVGEMKCQLTEQYDIIQKELTAQHIEDDRQKDALRCMLRNTITHIYYKYEELKVIPKLEKENFAKLCEVYFSVLDGNSYVNEIYEIVMHMPVI
ncbi:hypothetical protein M2140_000155 [Clostridiales Family XIII bacterium PM5-7]